MFKFSQNNFSKGMNKDFDERVVQSDTYRDAINFTLTNEGEFFSLSKIKSSGERIDLNLDSELVGQSVSKVDLLGSQEGNFPNEDSAVVLFLRVNHSSDVIITVNLETNEVYYRSKAKQTKGKREPNDNRNNSKGIR